MILLLNLTFSLTPGMEVGLPSIGEQSREGGRMEDSNGKFQAVEHLLNELQQRYAIDPKDVAPY